MTGQENQTSSPQEDPLGRKLIEVVFEAAFAMAILLSSILSNSIVLYVINANSNLKTFINNVIRNLCIIDLLETLLIMPLWIVSIVEGRWIFSSVVCSISGYLFVAIANATLFSLMLIAVTRYFKVVKPHLYSKIFAGRKSAPRIFLASSWILPLITCCPPIFGWGQFLYNPLSCLCEYDWAFEKLNITYMVFLVATQPSPYIICWSYVRIYYTVRRNRIQICTRRNRAACQNAYNAETSCIQLSLGIACGVVLCWLPKAILVLMMAAGNKRLDFPMRVSSYLVFLACSLNPVIYGMINPQFKPAFKALFKREANDSNIQSIVLAASLTTTT